MRRANFFALARTSGRAGRSFSRTRRDNVATLKPTTPLLAPNKGPLKPASPLRPKTAPKTPISHPQRRWRFQSRLGQPPQRRRRFQSRLGRRPQRRHRFQTSGPLGSRAGRRPWAHKAARPHWCGGRRRDRRARLRCPWAVAGPGRASRRRAERSSRRGRLAGGPPPTGTQSSPAQQAVGPDNARNTSGLRCNGVPTAALPGPS